MVMQAVGAAKRLHADLLVHDEVRRSGRSRSAVVEELAEEAAKTRLFPGVAFSGTPRRAWVIGTGLDESRRPSDELRRLYPFLRFDE